MILWVAYSGEIRDPAIFECHIDVLIPKSFGQIENSIESRSVRSCRNQSRVLQEVRCSTFYINTISTTMVWSHFARLVILAVGV
jgi:hypothetical protein